MSGKTAQKKPLTSYRHAESVWRDAPPERGTDGRAPSRSRFDAQSVVVQDPTHYETFTLYENVFLGEPHQRYEEKAIERALAFSGLSALENKLLGKYVGNGSLRRPVAKLAIARAAYRNRDLIVLDEPTSNLDPLAKRKFLRNTIPGERYKTVIYVTHRISVAKLADRIIVFKNGEDRRGWQLR